jgi:hypothetical protein
MGAAFSRAVVRASVDGRPIAPDDLPTGMRAHCARRISEGVYLVDTNVLSAGAPTKAPPVTDLAGWMERNSERLYRQ